jgi:hypothetical protein
MLERPERMILPVPKDRTFVLRVEAEMIEARNRANKILNAFQICAHCALPPKCESLNSCLLSPEYAIRAD